MKTLRQAIDELPKSAEEIRTFLAAKGYKGIADAQYCPLAMYLQDETGLSIEVDTEEVTMCGSIYLPPAAQDFVAYFDAGDYPELKEQTGGAK